MATPAPAEPAHDPRARRSPFESLPSRIITSVFAAALVTSVAVTWISTRSTEDFLRSKIDERFPALLQETHQRLDHWYAQRALDVDTFARSETVLESLSSVPGAVALDEAGRYLAYVQEGFPQYRALFVLDAQGETRVWVGSEVPLPGPLRAQLAALDTPELGRMWSSAQGPFQLISAPVVAAGGAIGTLHALVAADSLEALLSEEAGDRAARVHVVADDGRILASSPGASTRERYGRALPPAGRYPVVEDYTDPSGEHVVGSTVYFERLGWTLLVEETYDIAFAPVVSVIRKILAINTGIVLIFSLIAFTMARSIVRPIHALSDGARRIAQGETDVEIPLHDGQDEIGVLSRALNAMVIRLQTNQVELQRKQDEIEHANTELTHANQELRRGNEVLEQLSFTDGLTRLHNHRYFQDRIRMETKRCDRSNEPLALLLLDIDDFKKLNDRHGHAVGDEVLRRVAHVINNTVRETDVPARYGGEEFAVLAPRTGPDGSLALAEKLREAVSQARFNVDGLEVSEALAVTVSIGVGLYRDDPKAFFNDADRALYAAKAAGKDCVVTA